MAGTNINRVVLTGNLTRDPELRSTQGGTSVCSLRIATNSRRKDASGNWVEKPNYFDVTVWGAQGENCAQYLSKGRPVAIDGRLDWREWEDKPNYFDVTVWGAQGENCAQYLSKGRPVAIDGRLNWREWEDQQGNKRQSVDIIADSVQFLGSREGGENGGRFTPQSDVPADTADFASAPAGSAGDDDIPF